MIRHLFALLICMLFVQSAYSQSEFRHMHYNLALYGNPYGCDETTNNTAVKDVALQEIIAYAQPDIFTVNELRDQNVWADRILDNALNVGESVWARANLTYQFTGSSIINACFYRSDRFVLYGQEVVYQAVGGGQLLRPLDLYTFYMDLPSLASGDTAFITVAVAHLAASDAAEREDQTEALMAHIVARGEDNYIFTGDLNIDSSSETAFQNLISATEAQYSFIDPVTTAGNWHNNSSVSLYHTQSTRFSDTNDGCFAGSGLDDRFDLTLISPYLSLGSANVTYVSGSYMVLGQSGNDYNQELQTIGNQVVPDEVAQALYDMSDHLPVITDYTVDLTIGLTSTQLEIDARITYIGGQIQIYPAIAGNYTLEIFDLSGRKCAKEAFSATFHAQEVHGLAINQIIILRLSSDVGILTRQLLIR